MHGFKAIVSCISTIKYHHYTQKSIKYSKYPQDVLHREIYPILVIKQLGVDPRALMKLAQVFPLAGFANRILEAVLVMAEVCRAQNFQQTIG